MLRSILNLFKKHPAYLQLFIAHFVSSIGIGLTEVALFGHLAKQNASAETFALAFSLSVIPGLISSYFGQLLTEKFSWKHGLLCIEIIGAISLILPYMGILTNSSVLLFAGMFMATFMTGMAIPIITKFEKETFIEDEYASVAGAQNFIFFGNVMLGFGIGTLLFPYLATEIYFLLDFATYLFAILVIYNIPTSKTKNHSKEEKKAVSEKLSINKWTKTQWSSFLLLPLMTIICVPCVTLLPVAAIKNFSSETMMFGSLKISPVLTFLLTKTIGQAIGPLIIDPKHFKTIFKSPLICSSLVLVFLCCYYLIFSTNYLILAWFLTIGAHITSNIVYAVAHYATIQNFEVTTISKVSTLQYQIQILCIFSFSIIGAFIYEKFGFNFVLTMSLIVLTLIYLLSSKAHHHEH